MLLERRLQRALPSGKWANMKGFELVGVADHDKSRLPPVEMVRVQRRLPPRFAHQSLGTVAYLWRNYCKIVRTDGVCCD
jgi:hypothetical protein